MVIVFIKERENQVIIRMSHNRPFVVVIIEPVHSENEISKTEYQFLLHLYNQKLFWKKIYNLIINIIYMQEYPFFKKCICILNI